MTAHGPDLATFNGATKAELKPTRVADGTMAFMFETCFMTYVTKWATETSMKLQSDYYKAWIDIPSNFNESTVQK
jgi:homogentisate 1,2-dioxygenase